MDAPGLQADEGASGEGSVPVNYCQWAVERRASWGEEVDCQYARIRSEEWWDPKLIDMRPCNPDKDGITRAAGDKSCDQAGLGGVWRVSIGLKFSY